MKPPAPKVHLRDSEEPLKEGQDHIAICGERIPKAVYVFMWNEDSGFSFAEQVQRRLNVCRKCRELEIGKRYVYGLVSGQEREEQIA